MAAKAASGAHALACLRPVPNDRLEIRDDPAKGRGVFARQPIPGGTLIEAAPVIIVKPIFEIMEAREIFAGAFGVAITINLDVTQ